MNHRTNFTSYSNNKHVYCCIHDEASNDTVIDNFLKDATFANVYAICINMADFEHIKFSHRHIEIVKILEKYNFTQMVIIGHCAAMFQLGYLLFSTLNTRIFSVIENPNDVLNFADCLRFQVPLRSSLRESSSQSDEFSQVPCISILTVPSKCCNLQINGNSLKMQEKILQLKRKNENVCNENNKKQCVEDDSMAL